MDEERVSGTYLVEHYLLGATIDTLEVEVERICAAAAAMTREGKPVRVVRSTIVPDDEALLSVFEAASEDLVRDAYERAGVPFERISRAISVSDGRRSDP